MIEADNGLLLTHHHFFPNNRKWILLGASMWPAKNYLFQPRPKVGVAREVLDKAFRRAANVVRRSFCFCPFLLLPAWNLVFLSGVGRSHVAP